MTLIGMLHPFFVKNLLALFSIMLILMFFLAWRSRKELLEPFKRIRKGALLALLLIFLLAFLLRLHFSSEPGPSSDGEWEYKIKAYDFATDFHKVYESGHPQAYPFLLNLFYGIFGASDFATSLFNAVLGSLAVVLAFFLAFLLFGNTTVSLLSALGTAVCANLVRYSGLGEVETTALAFFLLLCIIFFIAARNQSQNLLVLSAVLFVFLVNVRIEFLSFFPFMAIAYLLLARKKHPKRLTVPGITLVVFLLATSFYINFTLERQNLPALLGVKRSDYDSNYYQYSYFRNIADYYGALSNTVLGSTALMFLLFGFIGSRRFKKEVMYLILILSYNLLVYGLLLPSNKIRYSIIIGPFLVLMISKGVVDFADFARRILGRFRRSSYGYLLVLVVISLLVFWPQVWRWQRQDSDVQHLVKLGKNYSKDYCFIFCNPFVVGFEFPDRLCYDFRYQQRPTSFNRKIIYFKTESAYCQGYDDPKNYDLVLIEKYKTIEAYYATRKTP